MSKSQRMGCVIPQWGITQPILRFFYTSVSFPLYCRADIASNDIAVEFLPGLLQKYIDDASHSADGNGNISINRYSLYRIL